MVKKYLFVFFFILPWYCFPQHAGFLVPVPGEGGMSLDTTSDGGYVVATTTGNNPNGGNFIISKIDELGNQSWIYQNTQFNGSDSDNYIIKIRQTLDHGIIGIGGIYVTPGTSTNYTDGIIIKLDSSGNLMWRRELDFNDYEYLSAIYLNDDTTYFIMGAVLGKNLLIKIDNNGDTIWTKQNINSPKYFGHGDIYKNGQFYYSFGSFRDSLSPSFSYEQIAKIDTSGNWIWTKTINDTGNFSIGNYYSHWLTKDSFLLSSKYMFNSQNQYYFQINKYDLQGNLINTIIHNSILGEFDSDTTMIGIIGTVGIIDYINGNIIKSYDSFYVQNTHAIGDIISDRKKNILFCGKANFSGFGDEAFLVKFSDTTSTRINYVSQKLELSIFPNPASEILNIHLNRKGEKQYYLELFNCIGELKYSSSWIGKDKLQIDVRGYPPGLYFLNVSLINEKALYFKIIIN